MDRHFSYGNELVAMTTYGDFPLSPLGNGMLEMLTGFRIFEHLLHLFGEFDLH
jgi:hypothetical protein